MKCCPRKAPRARGHEVSWTIPLPLHQDCPFPMDTGSWTGWELKLEWGEMGSNDWNGVKDFQMGWKRFSHLSTSPDLGNAELLIIGKQTQRVGNIPLKTKAGVKTLCPRSSTRPYLPFSFTRIPNVLNVPEVTEQNKMGPLYKVCHGRGRGGRSLKCCEGLAEWGYL